jgi:hypothetical protein
MSFNDDDDDGGGDDDDDNNNNNNNNNSNHNEMPHTKILLSPFTDSHRTDQVKADGTVRRTDAREKKSMNIFSCEACKEETTTFEIWT